MFAPVVQASRDIAIAVSGGSDSLALLVLFAEWLQARRGPPLRATVLTVDHGLRPGSLDEAQLVAAHAARLGLPHATLHWRGEKPVTGLAAAARDARYGLLCAYMRSNGIDLLLTGHTRDDQAETLLMRLARGSGIDGLAAMPVLSSLASAGGDLRIGRPLLACSKMRLANALRARNVAWAEDPTNLDPAYERPRLRAMAGALHAAGLTSAALAASARRLRRARSALEAVTLRFFDPALGNVHVDPMGYVDISLQRLRAEPEEIGLRVLHAAVRAVGGVLEPISMRALEEVQHTLLAAPGEVACTLARTTIRLRGDRVHIEREPGRQPAPAAALAPHRALVWDGRFLVTCGDRLPPSSELRALTAAGLARAEAAGLVRPAATAQVLRALPAIWNETGLLAIPSLEFSVQPEVQLDIAIEFLGMRDLCPGHG